MIVVAVASNGFLLLTPATPAKVETFKIDSPGGPQLIPVHGMPNQACSQVIPGEIDLLRQAIQTALADHGTDPQALRTNAIEHCPTRFAIQRVVDGYQVQRTLPVKVKVPEETGYSDGDSKLIKGLFEGVTSLLGHERLKRRDVFVFTELDPMLDFVLAGAVKALSEPDPEP